MACRHRGDFSYDPLSSLGAELLPPSHGYQVEAGKEIAWMRNEFGYGVDQASTLKMDNQSAITVSKNPEHHGCMKHLDLHFYWLRDKVEHGMLTPDFIPTGDMI